MLGDKESGKTTLIAKLAGNEDPKKGAGLEYGFINVRDEEREGRNNFHLLRSSAATTFKSTMNLCQEKFSPCGDD